MDKNSKDKNKHEGVEDNSPQWLHFLYLMWRRVENMVFGIITTFIFLYFVFQSSLVQNWIISKITNYLSVELKTNISIQHVDISFFDNFTIEGILVEDQCGDTLLYAESIKTGLNSNIFSLFQNWIEFNEISIVRPRLYVHRLEGGSDNNIQFILNYFTSPKPTQKPATLRIKIRRFRLTEAQFLIEDNIRGNKMEGGVSNAVVRINEFNLGTNTIDIQTIFLEGASFQLTEYSVPKNNLENNVLIDKKLPLSNQAKNKHPFRAFINRLYFKDSRFVFDRFDKSSTRHPYENVLDYEHLAVSDISLDADSIFFDADKLSFSGHLKHLAAREQSGLEIKRLESNEVYVNDTMTALYGFKLQTNGSFLTDSLTLKYDTYRDYNSFTNRVNLKGQFAETSKICIGDIMYFSPEIQSNNFFQKNREIVIDLSGQIDGRINRMNGRDLSIRLGNELFITGKFDGNDLAEGNDRIRLFFDLEHANTNIRTLRRVLPEFQAPAYFDILGNISYHGTYHILFGSNHILTGDLSSDVGFGKLDMKVDLSGGTEKATYSGYLNMMDFDMAKWTNNKDFGKSKFQLNIVNGSGLTLKTIKTRLSGTIDSFYFRGYNYQHVELSGLFEESVFDGRLNMEDPNIDFTFDGSVNFKDTIPEFDFKADLKRLDLKSLNLVEKDWIISGKIEKIKLFAQNVNDLRGAIVLKNILIVQDKKYNHRIDSLTFAAANRPDGNRYFILLSDIVDGVLEGRFELNDMVQNAWKVFYQYYPKLTKQAFGEPPDSLLEISDNYKINLKIKNTRDLTRLIDKGLDTLQNVNLRINFNASAGRSEVRLNVPVFHYNTIHLYGTDIFWKTNKDDGVYKIDIPKTTLNNNKEIGHVNLSGELSSDAVTFAFNAEDSASILQKISLNGLLSTIDTLWEVHFNTAAITLFEDQWFMEDENYIRFSSNYFETQNFEFMHDLQRISLESYNNGRGLSMGLANFDLNFFERFFKPDDITYRGKIFNLDIEIEDIFNLNNIQGYITTDTIFLNNIPLGALTGNAEMLDRDAPVWWRLFIRDKNAHELRILGAYALKDNKKTYQIDEIGPIDAGELQTIIQSNKFPLKTIELFIPDISKVSGTIDLDLRLGGTNPNKISMNGYALVDGHFQFDYLKAMFYIPNEKILFNEHQLWADGDTILDGSQKNAAIISGGLRHDYFQNWRLDCSIKSITPNFMIMNTLETDNELYYGHAIGAFEAKFSGTFKKTDIIVNAITGKETRLFIPLAASSSDVNDASFITFRKRGVQAQNEDGKFISKNTGRGDLIGLNFEMNISVTEDAEVQLIFDAQAGDIVKGRGVGNIRLVINREGEFKMYGTYQIRRGEYMFTLLNWVNKPFTVNDGGTISWYGDPYGAQINLEATYSENTSLYNLLRDELEVTKSLYAEASKATRTIVTMRLRGDLFKPNISFDLSFPNVTGQLKSMTDSKLSLLRQDQNELTRQVFGLIVVGSFLPPSGASVNIQSSDYLASAFNTLTQVLSNQFSNYLTGLASEWFGGSVSSIEFNIAYNEYRNEISPGQTNLAQIGRELQVRLTSGFADDRITVQLGSQIGLGQPGTTNAEGFVGEDVSVEIMITENRQWRLRVYQRAEPDIAGGSRRSRYGFGLNFRKEYETFTDLVQGLTGWMRSNKKQGL